jgi:hypothetical protein
VFQVEPWERRELLFWTGRFLGKKLSTASKIHPIVFQLGQKPPFVTGVEFYHRKIKKNMGLRATTRRHGIRAVCSWQTKSCQPYPCFFFPIF